MIKGIETDDLHCMTIVNLFVQALYTDMELLSGSESAERGSETEQCQPLGLISDKMNTLKEMFPQYIRSK